jgi:hypothetical protein
MWRISMTGACIKELWSFDLWPFLRLAFDFAGV